MLELRHNGVHVALINEGEAFALPERRLVSPAEEGWSSDDGYELVAYTPPASVLTKEAMLDRVRDLRWQYETGGIMVGGASVRTDTTSQAKITGAVSLFQNDPEMLSIDWEVQPGVWVTLNEATMRAIGIAVGRHVQACFSRARALTEEINAAVDEAALATIDIQAGWPQ